MSLEPINPKKIALGIEISKIENEDLRKVAENVNRDASLWIEANELPEFMNEALKLDIPKEDFNKVLGLYKEIKEPIDEQALQDVGKKPEIKPEAEPIDASAASTNLGSFRAPQVPVTS